jgi:hypothetical protein
VCLKRSDWSSCRGGPAFLHSSANPRGDARAHLGESSAAYSAIRPKAPPSDRTRHLLGRDRGIENVPALESPEKRFVGSPQIRTHVHMTRNQGSYRGAEVREEANTAVQRWFAAAVVQPVRAGRHGERLVCVLRAICTESTPAEDQVRDDGPSEVMGRGGDAACAVKARVVRRCIFEPGWV